MSTGELDTIESVVDAELVDTPGAELATTDPATAAVLAAMEAAADEHLDDIRPAKTKAGYARDWALWEEFHGWLAERTGHPLPPTAVTKGTIVGFVRWLDEIKQASPNSIDRRITGVTVTARSLGATVPKEATLAARQALKAIRLDETKAARGRGRAIAATPANLRQMNTTIPAPRRAGTPREYKVNDLALLRDRALSTMAFAIAGRSAEVSALNVTGITLQAEGLKVHVPSVKGRPARDVVVAYGQHPETCPVRCWLAWQEAAGLTDGPAFRAVDRWGNAGRGRLSPDGCRIVITRAAERSGIEVRLTGHSARAGLVTTARKSGKRVEKIREQTGHAANSPVFWEYVRDAEQWDDAATEGIGL